MKEVIYNFFKSIVIKLSSFFKRLAVKRRLMRKVFATMPDFLAWMHKYHPHQVPKWISFGLFDELEDYFSKDK